MKGHGKIAIAGGGLAGSLTAMKLAAAGRDVLLVEGSDAFGGNHVWSFFATDVDAEDRAWLEPMIDARWKGYDVFFPGRARTFPTDYVSTRSRRLDLWVRETLSPDQYRLSAPIASVEPRRIVLADGEVIEAAAVIDARGPADLPGLDLGWQKFVGLELTLEQPHGLERPIVMDARVEQIDGYRFVYCLPFAPDRLLVEDTYYSDGAELDQPALEQRVLAYADARGWRVARIEAREHGVLPICKGGNFDRLWPDQAARIGLRGAFFHPVTGYSLPDAVQIAAFVARIEEPEQIGPRLREEGRRLWKRRRFERLLSRMLFDAAAPGERWRVLEHFYRLEPKRVERFHADRLTAMDRMAIISGRPPVPIVKAVAAAIGRQRP